MWGLNQCESMTEVRHLWEASPTTLLLMYSMTNVVPSWGLFPSQVCHMSLPPLYSATVAAMQPALKKTRAGMPGLCGMTGPSVWVLKAVPAL